MTKPNRLKWAIEGRELVKKGKKNHFSKYETEFTTKELKEQCKKMNVDFVEVKDVVEEVEEVKEILEEVK